MNQTSKLVEALQKIANLENPIQPYAKTIAQQALESYKDGWVSVEERLPEGRMETCLVFNSEELKHKQHIAIGQYFQQIGGFVLANSDYKVTHWQPLPTPPQTKTI